MTEFFQYATSGFWVFLGCVIIIVMLGSLIDSLVAHVRDMIMNRRPK